MKIDFLSTTLIGGWPLCPLRTWRGHETRQVEGDDETHVSPLQFGSIVHDVAEIYHGHLAKGEDPPSPIDLFDSVWRGYEFYDLDYYVFGRQAITDFLDRTLFRRDGKTVEVELEFVLDLTTGKAYRTEGMDERRRRAERIRAMGGIPVASKIDRVDVLDETGQYEVYDYKTNFLPFTRDQVDNSLQLVIYDMAVRSIYKLGPGADIRCIFDMLRHGQYPTLFSPNKRAVLTQYMINMWHQISGVNDPPAFLNEYCSYCDFKDSCPVYHKAVSIELPPIEVADIGLMELSELLVEAKAVQKASKARVAQINSRFSAAMVDNDMKPVEIGDGQEAYMMANPRYSYPEWDVYTILKDNQMLKLLMNTGVMSISRPKLDEAMAGYSPEVVSNIKETLITNYASPSVKIRKIPDHD